jgi:hypothetical protein
VVREQVAIELTPFDQIDLLVVVRNQRDLLVQLHGDFFVSHKIFGFSPIKKAKPEPGSLTANER